MWTARLAVALEHTAICLSIVTFLAAAGSGPAVAEESNRRPPSSPVPYPSNNRPKRSSYRKIGAKPSRITLIRQVAAGAPTFRTRSGSRCHARHRSHARSGPRSRSVRLPWATVRIIW